MARYTHSAQFLEKQRLLYGDGDPAAAKRLRRREGDRRWKEARRQRYATDPEYRARELARVVARQKRKEVREQDRCVQMARYYGSTKPEQILRSAKYRAAERGWEFTISVETVQWPTHCPVLGIKLNYSRGKVKRPTDASPSLDRWDTTKGYTVENVRVISYRANRLKSNASPEELMAVAKYAMGWI